LAYRQLAVYRNPFSTAVTQPKIPDGKCTLSLGRKVQAVKEFTPIGGANGFILEFLLYPGLRNSVYVRGVDLAARIMPFDVTHASMTRNATVIEQDTSNAVGQWRTVSCGLKLTLVNNTDQNEGWWEAVRFATTKGEKTFDVRNFTADTVVDTEQAYIVPQEGAGAINYFANGIAGSVQMIENPSYMTGKLRDIHKYMFKLRPHNTEHDFNRVRREYEYQTVVGEQDIIQDLVDYDFDMCLIRVHCSDVTKIMAHTVHNIEAMYEPGSILATMHTQNPTKVPDSVIARAGSGASNASMKDE
jgi:hypothetical protein